MDNTIEKFLIKPSGSMSVIEYLKNHNANEISRLIDYLKGHIYWIRKEATWVKKHQDEKYISRANSFLDMLLKLREKGYFNPELSCLNNELVRSYSEGFNAFQHDYLNGHDYQWLYGDSLNCCFSIKDTLQIVSYCECSVVSINCKTEKAFKEEIKRALDFSKEEF